MQLFTLKKGKQQGKVQKSTSRNERVLRFSPCEIDIPLELISAKRAFEAASDLDKQSVMSARTEGGGGGGGGGTLGNA